MLNTHTHKQTQPNTELTVCDCRVFRFPPSLALVLFLRGPVGWQPPPLTTGTKTRGSWLIRVDVCMYTHMYTDRPLPPHRNEKRVASLLRAVWRGCAPGAAATRDPPSLDRLAPPARTAASSRRGWGRKMGGGVRRTISSVSAWAPDPETKIRSDGSYLFATTASTETLNGTILGVTCFSSPPCPKSETQICTVQQHKHH